MKLLTTLLALLSLLTWASALTLPQTTTSLITARADDESWTVITYAENQCQQGGTTYTSTQSVTNQPIDQTFCFDASVNVGFASCKFSFKRQSGGTVTKTVTVQGGKDSNNVPLDAEVDFVDVECELPETETE